MFSFLFVVNSALAVPCPGECKLVCRNSAVGECEAGMQCCALPPPSGQEEVKDKGDGKELKGGYGLEEAKLKFGNKLPTTVDIPTFLGKILGSVLGFTGTIFFVLMIVAGLIWMTSAGNDERVKHAKQILIAAVIGLIIVMSAYAITSFIGTNLAK